MRPFTVLIGIVLGSAASITFGLGAVLIARFEWILYIFGAFLLYSGFKLFGADHAVHPEKNLLVRWAQKNLPMSQTETTQELFVRQGRVSVQRLSFALIPGRDLGSANCGDWYGLSFSRGA